jgi:hypothetical protein
MNEAPMEVTKCNISKMKNDISKCNLTTIIQPLLDNNPYSYPTPIQMFNEQIEKHVVCGRRFDLSMLLFSVEACDCCSRLQPSHVDPCFPVSSEQPFGRKHFAEKYHKAWHCKYDGFCKGSQFYASTRKSAINLFRDKHNGQLPKTFLDITEPNAMLCNTCYHEISSDNVNGKF